MGITSLNRKYNNTKSKTIYLALSQLGRKPASIKERKRMNRQHLRNEFHFSNVPGAMNRSGSRAK